MEAAINLNAYPDQALHLKHGDKVVVEGYPCTVRESSGGFIWMTTDDSRCERFNIDAWGKTQEEILMMYSQYVRHPRVNGDPKYTRSQLHQALIADKVSVS